ncbi:MAG: ATP-binding protein [Lachnospiraceae bacterium]|nr:ATP-binding protein [Lachnospiraceae bacterium]MBO4921720.1 ATP-binding protein [Lachnospiraceae bacterium]MBR4145420.1 ATP-binding protein [Lachnospiraceae bacterium]MBR4780053.1 ATP-binding protein [Lachnospiraceae bacterium]MBR4780628.1 ATP-binding protein [Lachnospiraceae bacterium]
MSDSLKLQYIISDEDFTRAGEASGDVKSKLKMMGVNPDVIRKVSIAMYEGEINMVIHANGGVIDVIITPKDITMILKDKGPGIKDVDLAMQAGYSTASENVRALGFGAGMGLPNMKKYSDEMNIETELGVGTTVTMKVNF